MVELSMGRCSKLMKMENKSPPPSKEEKHFLCISGRFSCLRTSDPFFLSSPTVHTNTPATPLAFQNHNYLDMAEDRPL